MEKENKNEEVTYEWQRRVTKGSLTLRGTHERG